MGNNSDQVQLATPTEDFVKQVKDALEHLYDFPALQRHPLSHQVERTGKATGEGSGQELRRMLISAIEALNPGPQVPFRSPHARVYNLLQLHYVEGLTIQEAAHELGISTRQAYRDLRHGEESIAAVLWEKRSVHASRQTSAAGLSSIEAEIAQLESTPRPTDLHLLLHNAVQAVQPLARQCNAQIYLPIPETPLIVPVDPTAARQVLVNLLSRGLRTIKPQQLEITVAATKRGATVVVNCGRTASAHKFQPVDGAAAQLAERLGWTIRPSIQPADRLSLIVEIPMQGPTVLIIDDNEGLVSLLQRYLSDKACQVVTARSGPEGLRLAREVLPNAIVLDVMMPDMDGWELLQRLRANQHTAKIPVAICSVINDPELAYSLGASLFIPKPVRRDDVLSALHKLGVV